MLDSGSEVNAMSLAYAKRLDIKTWKTNVGAQKIDISVLAYIIAIEVLFLYWSKFLLPLFIKFWILFLC